MEHPFLMFLDHTQRRSTVGRTPLYEWSACRGDLYLTTHNIHNRQTSMPPVGFEPTISAGERPQTYSLDCAATGTGWVFIYQIVLISQPYFLWYWRYRSEIFMNLVLTIRLTKVLSSQHLRWLLNKCPSLEGRCKVGWNARMRRWESDGTVYRVT